VSRPRSKQRAPAGLGSAGRGLWRSVTAGLVLRPDELAVLREACGVRDTIELLQERLDGAPAIVAGSRGQQIVNPGIPELRLQRQLLATLLARLDVPEGGVAAGAAGEWEGLSNSQRARKAALARWRP
jgi:hypothetical protein